MSSSTPESSPAPRIRKFSAGVVLFVALSIAGFIFYAIFDKQVFPAASIDIKMSKEQAFENSKNLARSFGYDVDHSLSSTTFTTDDDAKTVLEFKLGVDKANELMKSQVPVWIWRTRFCKELSKDEMRVAYTTHGDFKSIIHEFENDRKIPTVSQDEALETAKQFVAKQGKQDLSKYELFDSGAEKRPNRVDYHFVWRKPGFSESYFKIKVEVAGNQVSTYRYWLDPTDTWAREYKTIRQSNELLGTIASFLLFLFIATTIGAFIYGLTQHNIRWRFTLISSGIVAVLVLLDSLNNFSYSFDNYSSSVPYSNFVVTTTLMDLFLAFGAFVMSVLLAGGAELVYRMTRPEHMAMQNLFTLSGMAKNDYSIKMLMGYLIVGIMMFWAIGYYKFGQTIGYFCPLGVDDYKVLGNICPAISGALIGVSAAGLEEFTCRVVALGLLQKWTKSFWLANLLQAMIWGFAHSQYPQEPCYARGVELTVVGLFFGFIIKNYGVLPCFIAHYLYDAFLTVEPVFASHNPLLIAPAIFVLLPFAIAVLYSKKWAASRKLHIESLDLTNAGQTPHVAPVHNEIEHGFDLPLTYTAMSGKKRLVLAAVGLIGLCFAALPVRDPLGKHKEVTVSSDKATAMAKQEALEDGFKMDGYKSVARALVMPENSDRQTWQFIYEKLGYEKASALFDATRPGLEWQVRFFKPEDPKTVDAYLNGDGTRRLIAIDDDSKESPGAKLDEDAALAIVENYFKKNRTEFVSAHLIAKTKTAQAARTDYKFDFSIPQFAVLDTPALLHTELNGDKLSDLKLDWSLPDEWNWPHKKQKWYQQFDSNLRTACLAIFIGVILWWSVHVLRAAKVPWRHAIVLGTICAISIILAKFNDANQMLFEYNTAQSFDSFVWEKIAKDGLQLLLQIGGAFLLTIVGLTMLKYSFPQTMQQLRGWILFKPNPSQRQGRTNIFVDGAIAVYAFLGFTVAFKTLSEFVMTNLSPSVQLDIPLSLANVYCSSVPFIDLFTGAVMMNIVLALFFVLIFSLWGRFIKTSIATVTAFAIIAVIAGFGSWQWQDCVISTVFNFAQYFAYYFFVRKVFTTNLLAYIFTALFMIVAPSLSGFLDHASQLAKPEIVFLFTLLALPAICALVIWLIDRSKNRQNVHDLDITNQAV
jgi:hypothetical protein